MTVLLSFLWCLGLYWPNQKLHLEKGGHGALLTLSLPLENIDFFFHLSIVSLHTKVFDFFSPRIQIRVDQYHYQRFLHLLSLDKEGVTV